MARTEFERRRFITRTDVDDAAAAGRPVVVGRRDLLTDEAAQRAMDLGVTVERSGSDSARDRDGATRPRGAGAPAAETGDDQLRRAVRAAVVAEMGHEPAGLDAAIDRVLARRR